MYASLFSSLKIGQLLLPNRIVMAPMTRSRADADRALHALNASYYGQRASAGLIIGEATQISEQGIGYPATPGIHTPKQITGWKLVTDAVHAKKGRIFSQLWHCGRISHSLWHGGALPVAPSAIAAAGQAFTPEGFKPLEAPRALETQEIQPIVAQYAQAAKNSIAAGFDGVEIHGANGYLIDQFTRDGSNKRTDRYGGSLVNRTRFALEVAEAVAAAIGADRVGFRISPCGTFNDMRDSNPSETFGYLVRELNKLKLAYLHVVGPETPDGLPIKFFRPLWSSALMGCLGLDGETAERAIANGEYDLAAFGRPYISNPDLPERLKNGASLAASDPTTFYGGTERGYTDYPAMSGAPA